MQSEKDPQGRSPLNWQLVATGEEWESCAQPFSFYHDFIPRHWCAAATEVESAPIHRLCTLARKMGVRSFLVEDALGRPEVVAEIAHLEAMSDVQCGTVSARSITFLRASFALGPIPAFTAEDVIGQAVIIAYPANEKGRHSYVFEAIFRVCGRENEALLLNHEVPIAGPYTIAVGDQAVEVSASYFCQQNGLTSVCAHSAVRTLLMNHNRERIDVADLNKAWGIDPRSGLVSVKDMATSLERLDLTLACYNFGQRRPSEAMSNDAVWSLIASLAQSGTPALLVFETGPKMDHVVPVLGHTLNSDEWHPQGSLSHLGDKNGTTSNSLWIDHLVINDDQLGPYFCMSRSGLFEDGRMPTAIKPKHVIALLPHGFDHSPFMAETLARSEFGRLLHAAASTLDAPRWLRLLRDTAERRIFRTVLINRDTYVAEIAAQLPDADRVLAEATLAEFSRDLPEDLWMCEVSLPNILLANKAKLGEVLISTRLDAQPRIQGIRLPGAIARVREENLSTYRFPIEGHISVHAPNHNPNRW